MGAGKLRWPGGKGRIFLPHLLALALYIVATLVVTYPLPLRLSTHTAQGEWAFDALLYIWMPWWTGEALFDLHTSPADLRLLQFPSGVYHPFLLAVDYVGFAGLLFARLASPLVAHNLLMLLAFVFNGFAAYLFCLDLTENRLGSFVAGLVFAFLPRRMGHALEGQTDLISTYWAPVYGLLLMHLLRRPRVRLAVLCGVSLSLSTWVEMMYVPYLLIPLTAAVVAHVSLVEQRSLRPALPLLGLMLGVAGLTAAPFLLPFVVESLRGNLPYLQERGMSAFSVDLLGFIAPAPTNPLLQRLGLIPSFARRVVSEAFPSETLAYLGLFPLALGVWAVWRRPRRTAVWALLCVGAAVLSLGPFLRVNGQPVFFEVDGIRSYVPMPYAILARLPGVGLGRAPGRLVMTVGLGLAVLVAYGLGNLAGRLSSFRLRLGLTGILSALIMAEYLVYWPIPTISLAVPDSLRQVFRSGGPEAVLNLPMNRHEAKQLALYYQTIHEHPIVGGWVFRDLPGSPEVASFLQNLHQRSLEEDIIPRVSPEEVAAVDRALGVGYVLLSNNYIFEAEAVQGFLAAGLDPPVWQGDGLAVFRVPPGQATVDEPVYGLSQHWYHLENWDGTPARWMPDQADVYIFSPDQQEGVLRFTAVPFETPQRLQVEVNGVPLPPLVVGDRMTYTTSPITLQPGLNIITFHAANGCTSFVGDPRCTGPARAAGADCDPYVDWERCLSILFQDIRFVGGAVGPAEYPLDIVLDERVRFLGYDLEGVPAPGESLSLTLYWQSLQPIERDCGIFVHLLRPDELLLAQHDGPPLGGIYPTSGWTIGDVFPHQVTLEIPADAPLGRYDLLAGMYTYPDIRRLPVASDRPHAQDGLIWLQSLEVGAGSP